MTQLPEWANWLVRDKDGKLCAFSDKPHKESRLWLDMKGRFDPVEETDNRYAHIKWEDEEPTAVGPSLRSVAIGEMAVEGFKKGLAEPFGFDLVNHPSHYKQGGLETIDIMQALLPHEQFIGYLKGNIIKYRERAEHKGNAEQDYAKAKWYYDKLMEVSE